METAYARRAQDSAQKKAMALYGDYRLTIASAALFATDEGRNWLRLVRGQEAKHLRAVISEGIIGDGQTAKGQRERRQVAEERFARGLVTLMATAAIVVEPAEADPLEQTLLALELTAYELAGQRATNAIALNRQRAEAQALLEQQGQQHSA
ncbi:hypothetical protein QE444_002225 [Pseudomonas sp. SORGH_AS199]|nr:hypothetical protein [Pseudomonas sp. SORGH_AS_0199]